MNSLKDFYSFQFISATNLKIFHSFAKLNKLFSIVVALSRPHSTMVTTLHSLQHQTTYPSRVLRVSFPLGCCAVITVTHILWAWSHTAGSWKAPEMEPYCLLHQWALSIASFHQRFSFQFLDGAAVLSIVEL